METLKGLLLGASQGMALATLGYFKSITADGKNEEFKPEKFFHTVVIGAVVGAAATVLGLTYDRAEEYLMSMGVVAIVEQAEKIVWRQWIQAIALKQATATKIS